MEFPPINPFVTRGLRGKIKRKELKEMKRQNRNSEIRMGIIFSIFFIVFISGIILLFIAH